MASKNGRRKVDLPDTGKSGERDPVGTAKAFDFSQIVNDTTVNEKAVDFPTDARLAHKTRQRFVRLAKKHGIDLRETYERVGKRMLITHQRYTHAKEFNRAAKALAN